MKKNCASVLLLLALLFLISGCETMKGAADGAKKDWGTLGKADKWMRDNLW